MKSVLSLIRVSKTFGDVQALSPTSISIESGTIYGLLGPNGAGKTTLLSIAAGLCRADTGSVHVLGHDLTRQEMKAKALLGYLPDTPYLYEHLTAAEMLDVVGLLQRVPIHERRLRAEALLDRLGLRDSARSRIETFSHGMKKRLALACSLIHRPPLLLLDEPTNGLDLEQSRICRDVLLQHAGDGGASLISTHHVDLVARICNRVGILASGKLIAEGSPDELSRMFGTSDIEEMYFRAVSEQRIVGP